MLCCRVIRWEDFRRLLTELLAVDNLPQRVGERVCFGGAWCVRRACEWCLRVFLCSSHVLTVIVLCRCFSFFRVLLGRLS